MASRFVAAWLRTALAIVVFLAFADPAAAVRPSSIALTRLAGGPTYGPGGAYAISGGVLQEGTIDAIYLDSAGGKVPIPAGALRLVASVNADFPFAVRYGGRDYAVPLGRTIACPAARFVQSGQPVLYTTTIPVKEEEQARYELKRVGPVTYAHRAFVEAGNADVIEFLDGIDFAQAVSELAPREAAALQAFYKSTPRDLERRRVVEDGSYLNTDTDTAYEAFLGVSPDPTRPGPWVDMSGLPLRYFYDIGEDGMVLLGVGAFDFPDSKSHPNYDFVEFYQDLALLRTIRKSSASSFDSTISAACPR